MSDQPLVLALATDNDPQLAMLSSVPHVVEPPSTTLPAQLPMLKQFFIGLAAAKRCARFFLLARKFAGFTPAMPDSTTFSFPS